MPSALPWCVGILHCDFAVVFFKLILKIQYILDEVDTWLSLSVISGARDPFFTGGWGQGGSHTDAHQCGASLSTES